MTLDVIIPVKDRAEILECVQVLNQLASIQHIIICDSGSADAQCLRALKSLEQNPKIQVLRFGCEGFNKGWLLNQGILHSTANYLLISDADILWNQAVIDRLRATVTSTSRLICCIQSVQESNPHSIAVRRNRYTYAITMDATTATVKVWPDQQIPLHDRPGYGLICTQRLTLLSLGAYKERFAGWGWEDQDLLMRATLMGIPIQMMGQVIHLSHEDQQRNQHYGYLNPSQTRDRNIALCLKELAAGIVAGDLPRYTPFPPYAKTIQTYFFYKV